MKQNLALLVDLYEVTMTAGYLREGMHETDAVFDLYFRENPFAGGYAVFAGLEPVLDYLATLRFGDEEIGYLRSLGLFEPAFLSYLRALRFGGRVTAMREGEVVFAGEPLLTVEAALGEAQLVETALLNLINYQTLVATKAARLSRAAGHGSVVEFGARRAQGPDGALGASRAAFIGGARTTSNVWAGQRFGIPVAGTQAHSWVMAFPSELDAFRSYAAAYPDHCILLADTYDTLRSGIPNAIVVARELRKSGHELRGVRLDSGDLAQLSREARRQLDEAGFPEVKVLASNELDEQIIESVRREGGQVDQWGVGTRLVTGAGQRGGALGGVYKLVEVGGRPCVKVSADPYKSTVPGRKTVWRAVRDQRFEMDVISDAQESPGPGDPVFHPAGRTFRASIPRGTRMEGIRTVVMETGARTTEPGPLEGLADYARERLSHLPEGCLRLLNPHIYHVMLTRRLCEARDRMIEEASHAGPQ